MAGGDHSLPPAISLGRGRQLTVRAVGTVIANGEAIRLALGPEDYSSARDRHSAATKGNHKGKTQHLKAPDFRMTVKVLCPHCGAPFVPRRKNMKYCSVQCRQNRWQNEDRQKRRNSPSTSRSHSKKRINYELYESAIELSIIYYKADSHERLGYIKDLVDDARKGNSKLRQVLSNRRLQYPEDSKFKDLMRRNRLPQTVSNRADAYCRRFWNAPVREVVYNRVPEPPTGEVF